MKKFSLKPLGDSCIPRLCKSWFFIGLIMAFCVSACGDDDENTVTPKFPEKQNIVCNAGETKEFTFEANTNWSLTSSAIWCKFEKDGMDEFILSGEAGKQTVTLTVTDDDQKVDNVSVAKLELTMGGQTIVIGEVTRSAVGYELKIYDEAGNEIQELEVGYNTYTPFKVKANFRFAATNLPSWVALEGDALVGAIDREVKGGLKIIADGSREKYPLEASEANLITFADESGKAFFPIKVYYKGMTPGIINITTPTSYATNWVVTLDGKTFTQKSSGGSTGDATIQGRMPFTVKTLNDDYQLVYMEKWEDWQGNANISVIEPNMLWMHCEGENGKLSLVVDEYRPNISWGDPEERTGYILAFSRAEYESIKDNLEETVVENGEIAYKYEQKNLLIGFTQKEVKEQIDEKSLLILKTGWEETSYTAATDPEILGFLQGNYMIENKDVYTMSGDAGIYYSIYPFLSDEWDGTAYVIDRYDNEITANTEVGSDNNGMFFGITVPDPLEEIIIVFKEGFYFKKALIITPN